ncbi:MAG TPA: SDR family NAD(P)-dependent oxidoreductase, partial [Candidatus Acidoferrales bacterium]|nr:SDR family NAD(P)-dependent oxidoreductase [Candidatus Acidoferrales bacterium]
MAGNSGDRTVKKWAGKWALVTGASAGIGEELARQLGAAGAHLVLTARRTERLQALASDFAAKYSTRVQVFSADLTQPGAPEKIYA